MDDETPSRTWTGIVVVDGPTFERFAKAGQLLDGTDARARRLLRVRRSELGDRRRIPDRMRDREGVRPPEDRM